MFKLKPLIILVIRIDASVDLIMIKHFNYSQLIAGVHVLNRCQVQYEETHLAASSCQAYRLIDNKKGWFSCNSLFDGLSYLTLSHLPCIITLEQH